MSIKALLALPMIPEKPQCRLGIRHSAHSRHPRINRLVIFVGRTTGDGLLAVVALLFYSYHSSCALRHFDRPSETVKIALFIIFYGSQGSLEALTGTKPEECL